MYIRVPMLYINVNLFLVQPNLQLYPIPYVCAKYCMSVDGDCQDLVVTLNQGTLWMRHSTRVSTEIGWSVLIPCCSLVTIVVE